MNVSFCDDIAHFEVTSPDWNEDITHLISGLIEFILSSFPNLTEVDPQTAVLINKVLPFVLFPFLWRYFRVAKHGRHFIFVSIFCLGFSSPFSDSAWPFFLSLSQDLLPLELFLHSSLCFWFLLLVLW
jgi:hypothetical protein